MRKIVLVLSIICCLFAVTIESKGNTYCSPVHTPFAELLNDYNMGGYIIVEGYFQQPTKSNDTSKLKVTRTSDASINIGEVYDVFEYGPFGSMCEMYEMSANVSLELIGKENPRLLILYKTRSKDGKLVTPIFWQSGVNASKNKIVTQEYDNASSELLSYTSTTSLKEIWKQISTKTELQVEWEKMK